MYVCLYFFIVCCLNMSVFEDKSPVATGLLYLSFCKSKMGLHSLFVVCIEKRDKKAMNAFCCVSLISMVRVSKDPINGCSTYYVYHSRHSVSIVCGSKYVVVSCV